MPFSCVISAATRPYERKWGGDGVRISFQVALMRVRPSSLRHQGMKPGKLAVKSTAVAEADCAGER
jgi:hypothetical protein